jgi:hypothetical protein
MAKALTNIKHGGEDVTPASRTAAGGFSPESERLSQFTMINAGDDVDKSDFSDEEWQALLDSHAVSEEKDAEPGPVSPTATAGSSEALTDEQIEATAQGEGQSGAPAPPAQSEGTDAAKDLEAQHAKLAEASKSAAKPTAQGAKK